MSYTTLRQAVYKIRENSPFTGSSMVGEMRSYGDACKCGNAPYYYTVISYAEPIYAECRNCGRYWYNREHYSVTTSRHQSVVRQAKHIQYHHQKPGMVCACGVKHREPKP